MQDPVEDPPCWASETVVSLNVTILARGRRYTSRTFSARVELPEPFHWIRIGLW